MPQSQTTPEKDLSNPWTGKGFCEPNQYKSTIDRGEGGYKSLELGIEMFKSLDKIIEHFSAELREWSKTSQKHISESKEFGTTKKVWLACVRITTEHLTAQNDAIAKGIQEKVVDEMTRYKNNHYGKSFIHVKKMKDFEHDFKKVQKPWLELLDKINDAKQAYHDASRKLHQAEGAEKIIQTDVGATDDQKKKLEASLDKRKRDTKSYREKYERLIEDMEKRKVIYEKDMFDILARTDKFEEERLQHFNSIFKALKHATVIDTNSIQNAKGNDTNTTQNAKGTGANASQNAKESNNNASSDATVTDGTKHSEPLGDAFEKAIKEHNIQADIDYFNKYYGRETQTKWPVFEEFKA
jgi:hypothetical protein